MKYLLTGACGFIGSNIALNLLNNGHEVINLDKLTYAANTEGFDKYDKYKLIKLDICNLHVSDNVIDQIQQFKPDYIIHLAAESMVDRSLTENKIFFETNLMGTWNILELLRTLEFKKAIFFSTDEVYGSLNLQNFSKNDFTYGFRVTDPLSPRNPYAGSKAAADQVILSYTHSFNLPISIVRPTNNYGPRQAYEKFVPVIISSILNNKKIPIYGNGNFYREWLYVCDMCKAVEILIEKGKKGVIYNIGSGNRMSNLEIVNSICKLMDADPDKIIEFIADPRGDAHDKAYAVNSHQIRDLGWVPTSNMEDALSTTVDYYKMRKFVKD